MPELIIYQNGVYNLWDVAKPAPRFEPGLSRLELEALVANEHGGNSMAVLLLPDRLARAHARGTSSVHETPLEYLAKFNQAGEGERCIPFDEFVARLLKRAKAPNQDAT